MKFRPSAACAVLALGALLPSTGAAQSTDAFVLPFGMFRLEIEGTHAAYASRFDASGARVPVGEGLAGELTPARFAVIRPLAAQLGEFLQATQDGPGASPDPGDPEAISLGLLDIAAAESRTEAVARISVGLLPRVEIGASLPMSRGDRLIERLSLSGGSLGRNPDVSGNAALLSEIGWESLGESPFLPTAESPLGVELQSRVTALTGQPMTLPRRAPELAVLQAILMQQYGLPQLESRLEQSRVGDVEIHARGRLLGTFGDAPVPLDPTGVHFRVTVLAGTRLPTGTEPVTLDLLSVQPTERLSALRAGAAGDLFVGPRLWMTGALQLTRSRSTEVIRRVAPPGAPLSTIATPSVVTITPGHVIEIRLAPRVRLHESISLGGDYRLLRIGDTRFGGGPDEVDASVLNLAGGALHRIGVGIRYSSLPAYWAERASLPAEVVLGYARTLSGPHGQSAGGTVTITASVLPRLW